MQTTSAGPRTRRALVALALAGSLAAPSGAVAADPDVTPPHTFIGDIPFATNLTSLDVTFWATGSEPDVTFECQLDAGPWTPCVSPWQLHNLTEGSHDISVRGTDAAGNTNLNPTTKTTRIDLSGPIGQLAINAGAPTTGRSVVRLSMSNSDGLNDLPIRISNRPDVNGNGELIHAWIGYEWQFGNGEHGWDLAGEQYGGTMATGSRTVYLQFLDQLGNVGPVTTDTIVYQPGITPVTVRVGATENPAETGAYVGIRATVAAADGARIRDGRFSLGGCPGESPTKEGNGELEIVLECSSWTYPVGTLSLYAIFSGSAELAEGSASMSLKIGPSTDPSPPRIWLLAKGSIHDGDPTETFTVTSSIHETVTFECRIDGGPWVACGPEWTVPRPAPGLHVLEARGRDANGNASTVTPALAWRVAPDPSGSVTFDDYRIENAIPTTDPIIGVTVIPSSAAPLAVRVSSSVARDAQGRLAKAVELANPVRTTLELNTEDPITGGGPGDGTKWIVVQWRAPDGSWEVPVAYPFQVDRKAPSLRLVVNANQPFVDDDEVLVLPKTDESMEATVLYSNVREHLERDHPDGSELYGPVWKIGEIPPGTVATRTIYARAHDMAGNWSTIASATITIDRTAPTSTMAAPRFAVDGRVTTTSFPVRVGGVATDTGSGVGRVVLQEAVGTGAFKQVLASSAATVATVRTISPSVGRTYRVGGTDRLGHVGAPTLGPTLRPYLRDETSAAIAYGAGWRRVAATAIGSDVMRSAIGGARLDFRFTGRAVAVIAPRRSTLGRAQVYLDGRYIRTIDLRAGSAGAQLVVFSGHWNSAGPHRLTLRVVASSGRPFDLDAVAVIP